MEGVGYCESLPPARREKTVEAKRPQSQPGVHVVLNGPCSSGKTSTAKALQERLDALCPNALLGIDAFHLAISPSKLELGRPDPAYLHPE